MTPGYWADHYKKKLQSASEAVAVIKPGRRIFIGTSCGEPQHLVKELARQATRFTDVEIVRLFGIETTPLTSIASETSQHSLTIRSFYEGSTMMRPHAEGCRFFTPINLSAVPHLFQSRQIPIHVALIQVSPPDDFGWMSLGISVDITLAAALSADLVIAQVNPRMPRILGHSFIHLDDVDTVVEHEEELLTVKEYPVLEPARLIARHITKLIEDGSTIHLGLGATANATLQALSNKNDLGVHSRFISDGMVQLVVKGVINNRKKGLNDGKCVASSALGTTDLYAFLHDNPSIEFYPSDYVNNPTVIAAHSKMISIHVATIMDLTGQVAADAQPQNHFSGVSGMLDFVRGAAQSQKGKSILLLPSTSEDGKTSNIVPMLENSAVVVPRSDVYYVVTEFGVVNLFGKSLQERAMAMISLAHPDHRDQLFFSAKQLGLIGTANTLKESIHAVYPLKFEEIVKVGGSEVTIRPAKPVDERRIQEHFYNLDFDDVISRFFHRKTSFIRDDVASMYQIDYVREMTIVAVVGEFGFGKVIAIGGYALDQASNIAEVAFSVSKEWQCKGLSKIILKKLMEAARDNGISGFVAYTSVQNRPMVRLFNTLIYPVQTVLEDGLLAMTCRFNDQEPRKTRIDSDSPPAA
jgi:acyl-CoA hydrolase/GNAT superfamily N-acetyltransferase